MTTPNPEVLADAAHLAALADGAITRGATLTRDEHLKAAKAVASLIPHVVGNSDALKHLLDLSEVFLGASMREEASP